MSLPEARFPNNWKIVPIDSVVFFQEGPGVRKHQYTNEGVKLLNGGNINNGILSLDSTERYISDEEAYGKYSHFLVEEGDLLIACSGVVVNKFEGKIAYARKEHLPLCMNTSTMRFRALDSNVLDIDYFRRFLQTNFFKRQLQKLITGSAQLNFGPSHIKQMEIPLPPLDEQKRIAAILDKADAIRRKRLQALQLADNFLKSVFLDMFGTDLQGNDNVIKFGDISILDAKMVDPREEEYLDLLHIGPDRIEKNTGKLLPALSAREERLISKKFVFDEQYILYSKIRPYLRKAALPDFRALCSADIYPIKPVQGKVTREFIWMLLLSDYFDNYVFSLPARANIPKLNKTELAGFEFSLPEFSKIEKFTEIVKRCFERSKAISANYADSESLFNSLSQKAFAGEL